MNFVITFVVVFELCMIFVFGNQVENPTNNRILVGSTASKSFWFPAYNNEPSRTDFLMARINCHNPNERSSLASIENAEENGVFSKYFIESGDRGNYWTSGTNFGSLSPQPARGTQWIWASTQNPVVYSNWIPCVTCAGRPHKKCIQVSYSSDPASNYGAYWFESDCREPQRYACQTML